LKGFHDTLTDARAKLERITFGAGGDIVSSISDLQSCKSKVEQWAVDLERLKDGQKLLEKQKFHFPLDWLNQEKIEGDWMLFRQILSKKSQAFESETSNLRNTLEGEDTILSKKVAEIETLWNNKKPYRGE